MNSVGKKTHVKINSQLERIGLMNIDWIFSSTYTLNLRSKLVLVVKFKNNEIL